MFVLIAILLGILIGLIRKGKLSYCFKERPFLWGLCVFGLLIQVGLHLLFYANIGSPLLPVFSFASYVMILIPLVFDLKNIWMILMAAGCTVNFLVVFINGGSMPVSANVLKGVSAVLAQSIINGTNSVYMLLDQATTRLWFLGDVIAIPKVGSVTGLYGAVPSISVGTLVTLIGLCGWIQSAMTKDVKSNSSRREIQDGIFDGMGYDEMSSTIFLDNEDDDDGIFFRMGDALKNDETMFGEDILDEGCGFQDDEEDSDMTECIPRLTPEMIEEIRRKSLNEADELLNNRDIVGETRVYTALRNLNDGKVEVMNEKEQSDRKGLVLFEEEDMNESSGSKETIRNEAATGNAFAYEPQWEWKKGKSSNQAAAQIVSNQDETETVSVADAEEQSPEVRENRKASEWNPMGAQRSTYVGSRQALKSQRANPYSTLYNSVDKKGAQIRSTDEMRNIWHRAGEKDKLRRKGYDEAESEEIVSQSQSAAPVAITGENDATVQSKTAQAPKPVYEQALEAVAQKWDEKKPSSRLLSLIPRKATERVDSKAVLRKSLSENCERKVAEAVTKKEREKAGYEKVELDVEGRLISFWRKRKTK